MSVLRMLTAGACLLLGTTIVLTQDQRPPQKGDTSGTKDQVKAFPSAEGFEAETRGAYGKAGVTPRV